LWLIPSIFGTYFIWDLIKFLEYRGATISNETQPIWRWNPRIEVARILSTLLIWIAFVAIAFLYFFVLPIKDLNDNLLVIIASFGLVIFYRVWLKNYREKVPVTLTLRISGVTVKPRGSYEVDGYLKKTSSGSPVSSKRITITVTDVTSGAVIETDTLITRLDGTYLKSLTAPENAGEVKIQAHFDGDIKYEAKDSDTKTVKVQN
jgi:hypothetical protein